MVFRRRDKPPFLSRVRQTFAPRGGWGRALEYISHRVRRLPDTPHRIALGLACGMMASFTPFFGLHFVMAALFARLVRGNMLAALFGTIFGNPVTFPLIATLSLSVGQRLLGRTSDERGFGEIMAAFKEAMGGLWDALGALFGRGDPNWDSLAGFAHDIWWPYCIGGILPGFAASVACYFLSRPLIAAYQARRRAKAARNRAGRAIKTGRHSPARPVNLPSE